MSKSITEQLKEVASDVFTEDTLATIEESYNEAVETKADELANLRVEKALVEQDEDHAGKLQSLLEAIDTDHTDKLKKIVEAIDKNHGEKLLEVAKKFNGTVNEEAGTFKESVVNNISNYLDLFLEKHVPVDDIQEAVKNKRAQTVLEQLRQVLSVDKALAKSSIREAVEDGKRQIVEAKSEAANLQEDNQKLAKAVKTQQAQIVLEKVTAGLPEEKRRHMSKVLAGKNAEFIKENFEYTLKMFEKTEEEKVDELKKEVTKEKTLTERPINEKAELVQESVQEQIAQDSPDRQDPSLFGTYMGELTKW